MKTTIDIPLPLLRKIRDIRHQNHWTLTRTVQELISRGLKMNEKIPTQPSPFRQWDTLCMNARIDYTDKEALEKALEKYQ
ncbi:MAG: hypothetical protein JW841_09970 [Deltaproteobacteria bacterium]|nr:hypothetical protein [Deltaproteobacteria bacterium]